MIRRGSDGMFLRALRLVLCASLVLSSWLGVGSAWADPVSPPPQLSAEEALRLLEGAEFFKKDADGRLRNQVVRDGALTPFGASITRMYQQAAAATRAAQEELSRENAGSGPASASVAGSTETHRNGLAAEYLNQWRDNFQNLVRTQASDKAVESEIIHSMNEMHLQMNGLSTLAQERFGDGADVFRHDSVIRAAMDGAAAARRDLDLAQARVMRNDTHVFVFAAGGDLAFVQDKEGNKVFDAGWLEAQRAAQAELRNPANSALAACAGWVDLTGRPDYALLRFRACKVQVSLLEARREMLKQRVTAMAGQLGESPTGSQLDEPKSLESLEEEYSKKFVRTGSFLPPFVPHWNWLNRGIFGYRTAGEVIGERFKDREGYLGTADQYFKTYEAMVATFQGRDNVAKAELDALTEQENFVRRPLLMANLDSMAHRLDTVLDVFSYAVIRDKNGYPTGLRGAANNPAAAEIQEAIDKLPPEARRGYKDRIDEMGARLLRALQVQHHLRAKIGGSSLTSDARGLQIMLGALQSELVDIGRMQIEFAGLVPMAEKYKQQGRRLSDLNGSWWGATLVNHLHAFFVDPVSYTPMTTLWTFQRLNDLSSLWGGDWFGDYLRKRKTMEQYRPNLERIVELVGQGRGWQAYVQASLMDPGATDTHLVRPLARGADPIGIADRLEAVMRKARSALQSVMDTHQWTGVISDTIKWSLFLSVSAPLLGRFFLGRALALEPPPGVRQGWFRAFRSEIYRNIGLRLEALSPQIVRPLSVRGLIYNTQYRFWRAAGAISGMAFMFGAIGGISTLLTQHAFKGKASHFTWWGDAIWRGTVGSAQFLTQSWHPLIVFVNIPYTAYRGTRLGTIAEGIAGNGVFSYIPGSRLLGGILARVTGKASWRAWAARTLTMETATSPARHFLVRNFFTTLQTSDHLLKFHLFTHTLGYLGEHAGYHVRGVNVGNPFGVKSEGSLAWMPDWARKLVLKPLSWYVPDTQRADGSRDTSMRTRYAHADGRWWESTPLWMLLPMGPAQNRASQAYRYSQRVFDWIMRYGTVAQKLRIINAAAVENQGTATFNVKETDRSRVYKQGWLDRLMNGPQDARLRDEGVPVTEKVQAEMMRNGDFLLRQIENLYKKNPWEHPELLLELSRMNDGQFIGPFPGKPGQGLIKMTKVVREVLQEKLLEVVESRPGRVIEILKDNKTPQDVKEAFSRIVRSAVEGGGRPDRELRRMAEVNLARFDAAWKEVKETLAKKFEAAAWAKKDTTPGLEALLKEILKLKEDLEREMNTRGSTWHYTDTLKEIRQAIDDADAGKFGRPPTAAEMAAMRAALDYFDGIEKLFNLDNNLIDAGKRIEDARMILKTLLEKTVGKDEHAALQALYDAIDVLWQAHKSDVAGLPEYSRDRVANGRSNDLYENGNKFDPNNLNGLSFVRRVATMVEMLQNGNTTIAKNGKATLTPAEAGRLDAPGHNHAQTIATEVGAGRVKLSAEQSLVLDQVLSTVRRAPSSVVDWKGGAIMGWRAGQFLAVVGYVMGMVEVYGAGKPAPKIFIMAPTGGGKTQILTIGVLPIAEAVAARRNRTFVLGTNKRILVEQMMQQIEAMNVLTKTEVKTWSDIVSKQAQRKLVGGNATRDISMALDEGDAPTILPQTTVGEDSGHFSHENLARRRLKESVEASLDLLTGRHRDIALDILDILDHMEAHHGVVAPTLNDVKLIERLMSRLDSIRQEHGKLLEAQRHTLTLEDTRAALAEAREVLDLLTRSTRRDLENLDPVSGVRRTGKKFEPIRDPLSRFRSELEALETSGKVPTFEQLVELNVRMRVAETGYYQIMLRGRVKSYQETLRTTASGIPDAKQVEALRDLGARLLTSVDSVGRDGRRIYEPHTLWERTKAFFGVDLWKSSIRARMRAENELLGASKMSSEGAVRELKELARNAEKMGESEVARTLSAEAARLESLGPDVWEGQMRSAADVLRVARRALVNANVKYVVELLRDIADRAATLGEGAAARNLRAEALRLERAPVTFGTWIAEMNKADVTVSGIERGLKLRWRGALDAARENWLGRSDGVLGLIRVGRRTQTALGEIEIRKQVAENQRSILQLLRAEPEGWLVRADILLQYRAQLLERSVTKRSPVWEVYDQIWHAALAVKQDLGDEADPMSPAGKLMQLRTETVVLRDALIIERDALKVELDRLNAEPRPHTKDVAEDIQRVEGEIRQVKKELVELTFITRKLGDDAAANIAARDFLLLRRREYLQKSATAREGMRRLFSLIEGTARAATDNFGYLSTENPKAAQMDYMDRALESFEGPERLVMTLRMALERIRNVVDPLGHDAVLRDIINDTTAMHGRLGALRGKIETAIKVLTQASGPREVLLRHTYDRFFSAIERSAEIEVRRSSLDSAERRQAEAEKQILEGEMEKLRGDIAGQNRALAAEVLEGLRRTAESPEPAVTDPLYVQYRVARMLASADRAVFPDGLEGQVRLQAARQEARIFGEQSKLLTSKLLVAEKDLAAEVAKRTPGVVNKPLEAQIDALTSQVRSLKEQNKTVQIDSHRAGEVIHDAETGLIVRDGRVIQVAESGLTLRMMDIFQQRARAEVLTFMTGPNLSRVQTWLEASLRSPPIPEVVSSLRLAWDAFIQARGSLRLLADAAPLSRTAGPNVRQAAEAFKWQLDAQTRDFSRKLAEAYRGDYMLDRRTRVESLIEIASPRGLFSTIFKTLPAKLLMSVFSASPSSSFGRFLRRMNPASKYVEGEILAMHEYHHNRTSQFRFDGIFKRVESVHVGDISPGLQQKDKAAAEVERRVDIQKRLKDRTRVGSKEMFLDDPEMPSTGASGTGGRGMAWEFMRQKNWIKTGRGSVKPDNIELVINPSRAQTVESVLEFIRNADAEWQAGTGRRKAHVIFVADNRGYREVRDALRRGRGWNHPTVPEPELSAVFSDTSYFAENFPRANIEAQKNLDAIKEDRADILIMHSAHSRGIDPFFHHDVIVHILDPHLMSESQVIQAIGRAAEGRRAAGTTLSVRYYASLDQAGRHILYRQMAAYDPFVRSQFDELRDRAHAAVLDRMALEHRVSFNLTDLEAQLRIDEAIGRRGPSDPRYDPLIHGGDALALRRLRLRETIMNTLDFGQRIEESQQLQGSGFFGDKPPARSQFRPLPWVPEAPGLIDIGLRTH